MISVIWGPCAMSWRVSRPWRLLHTGGRALADLITYLRTQPVISSAMVMDHLGVTRRTALSLIGELVDAGCLSNLTARSTSRFWALPSLAAPMGHAGGVGAVPRKCARQPRGAKRTLGRQSVRWTE